jgi:site-specific recombinase XerD
MEMARAISPEFMFEPDQLWQKKIKAVLEKIEGGRSSRVLSIEHACTLYIKSLFRRGMSTSTIKRCYYYLKVFTEWCNTSGINDITTIGKSELRSFMGYCKKERGLGVRSLKSYHWKVKGLFSFLVEQGYIKENPMQSLRVASSSHGFKQIIRPEECARLLETVIAVYETLPEHYHRRRFYVFRDLVIIKLLLATGLRVSELAGLSIGDVDLANGLLYVQGKGSDLYVKRNRVAFIDLPDLKNDLVTYLSLRGGKERDPLFPSKLGRSMSPATYDVMIKKWGKKAGIRRKLSCHLFRHTFCTQLIANGADVYSVQKLMGHHNIETTLNFYLHLTQAEVKADWQKYNPLRGR